MTIFIHDFQHVLNKRTFLRIRRAPFRPSERDKCGQSLWAPDGGEWRWFPGDKWHNPHWDHNSHDGKSSPWVNVPRGGLPPVKQ
jgi:hypothetical protein